MTSESSGPTETGGDRGTNLAERGRPHLSVTLSVDPRDPDLQIQVGWVDAEPRAPRPGDYDYWDQVVDLTD